MNALSNSTISKLYTEYSINELYGSWALLSYLEIEKFDIQSMKKTKRWKKKIYSYKNISDIWDQIIIGLTEEKRICLPKMLMSFYDRNTTNAEKKDKVKTIFDIAMENYYHWQEVNQEAIVLGMGMMLEDKLYWDDTGSIIHIIGNNVISIVETKEDTMNQIGK